VRRQLPVGMFHTQEAASLVTVYRILPNKLVFVGLFITNIKRVHYNKGAKS